MSLQAGIAQLKEALQELQRVVHRVQFYWTDAMQREFSEQYMKPLEDLVRHTLGQMQRLEENLRQMQHDCT